MLECLSETVVGTATKTVLLVGNPNVGKSVLFNKLTGHYVSVSNYPGTTVEVVSARGSFDTSGIELVDTPGINNLTPLSEDERVTSQLIQDNPEATIVQVADAKNLRRALFLTVQLAALKRPLVLVLNMSDELERCGIRIDTEALSGILGIPVVSSVAIHDRGLPELIAALPQARVPQVAAAEETGDEYSRTVKRLEQVKEILAQVYTTGQPEHAALSVRLGFWAMHPVKGLAVVAVVLSAFFWFVGLFGAGTMVDFFEVAVFQQRINPWVIRGVDAILPFPHTHGREKLVCTFSIPLTPAHDIPLGTIERQVVVPAYSLPEGTALSPGQTALRLGHDFLVGEYGAITMAIAYALAIVLPIVTAFFLLFSLVEDSGYLPRLSIMVNRLFRLMGLNGKAVLPMVLGLGCGTMATMTTRILESRKDRIVATLLIALTVPCSAQLGVLLAMMATISFTAAALWVVLMVALMFMVGWITSRIFPGESSDFIIELPPMRRPQLSNVLTKTFARLKWYLKEVIPLFVIGTAVLFLLDSLNLLDKLSSLGEPLVSGWLGLPKEVAAAFLIGFMRRDFGAVYLLAAATGPNPLLSPHQVLVAMVTITLFMPCIATFFMITKEYGQKVAWGMMAFIIPFAFLVGGLVHHLGQFIGV